MLMQDMFFFLGAKICHAIMSCNTDETTLFFVVYYLWFVSLCNVETDFKFNLAILDSILTLEFIIIDYCMF